MSSAVLTRTPTIRVFEPAHLLDIQAREFDRKGLLAHGQDYAIRAALMCAKYPAYTAFTDEGQVIICAGVIVSRPGIADGWAVTSDLVQDYGLWLTRTVKTMLNEVMAALSLRRVQVSVDPLNVMAPRWAHALGFQYEGTMRGFGPDGQPYDLYAKVRT